MPTFLHRQRQDGHDLVTINDIALSVHGQAAVRVTIVSNTDISTVSNNGSSHHVEVGGTHTVIDV